MTELRHTPLAALHEALGARMVPFAGFSMPVQYESIVAEHRAARETAALFDVSHMGQLRVTGSGAATFADRLCSRPMADLASGRVRYALLCNEKGGVVDDVTVYRAGDDDFLFCVNAANIAKDRAWLEAHAPGNAQVADESDSTGLLALQGPEASAIASALAPDAGLGELRRFRFAEVRFAGCPVLASRTGYTGADGYEIYCRADDAPGLWEAILETGRERGIAPAGLGARDTLRLEAALPLYGQELDDETSPLDAGLGRFVDLDREFLGAAPLRAHRDAGSRQALVGFQVTGRGIGRAGYPVRVGGEVRGRVTSGAPSPTLGHPIGLAYVPVECQAVGSEIEIEVRGRAIPARVVETPFVSGRAAGRPGS